MALNPQSHQRVFYILLRKVCVSPVCSTGDSDQAGNARPAFFMGFVTQEALLSEEIFKRVVRGGFEVNPKGIRPRPLLLRSTDRREHGKVRACLQG